jgi:hypothetical protein
MLSIWDELTAAGVDIDGIDYLPPGVYCVDAANGLGLAVFGPDNTNSWSADYYPAESDYASQTVTGSRAQVLAQVATWVRQDIGD